MKCRICGWEEEAGRIQVREMMIPTKEVFTYVECASCHCLQIEQVPENLGRYYGPGYYSFQEEEPQDSLEEQLPDTEKKEMDMTPILDVGCGSGNFLRKLAKMGHGNLTGCDPFLEKDKILDGGIRLYSRSVHEMDGTYKLIYLNDSFEHVSDPHEVMDSLRRLLLPGGVIRIKLPVYPNIAYDMFGTDWYQLDAPRHLYLHSVQSMQILAGDHGLQIVKTEFDANPSQIYHSMLYAEDIPFWEHSLDLVHERLTQEDMIEIWKLTKEANEKQYGDHAVFYLTHAK